MNFWRFITLQFTPHFSKKFNFWLILGSALWSFWLSAPYFIRGPLSYVKVHCNNDSWIPRIYWCAEQSKERFSSLLEPAMCTLDRIADYGVPSIFDISSLILPVPVVYCLLMWLQRLVAVVFTTLLLSRVFKASRLLSVLAGLLFSLGNTRGENSGVEWIYIHLLHEPGLPMLLFLTCSISLNMRRLAALWGVLLGLFIASTSQTEIGGLFTLPIAFIFALIAREDVNDKRSFFSFLVLCSSTAAGFVIYQIPHLWALILNASESARSIMLIEPRKFLEGFALMMYRFEKCGPKYYLAYTGYFFQGISGVRNGP